MNFVTTHFLEDTPHFLHMCISTARAFHTPTISFAAHQPIWYTPTAARTTDERHRHSAKQLVQQCSNLHVNKRNWSWVPKALVREKYGDSLTGICVRSPLRAADM